MKLNSLLLPLACLCASISSAQTGAAPSTTPTPGVAPTKVGVIDIQSALIQTRDGQKAAADLKGKFGPKQSELERKQGEIQQLQQTLSKGSNAMSEEAKQKTMRDIDAKTTSLKRDSEDAQADVEQEQQRIMGELGGKMISVLNKYATENGFALVIDISSQQTPVLFASNTIDITRQITELYDKVSPTMTSSQPATRPAPAVNRPTSTTPRSTVPPVKKP